MAATLAACQPPAADRTAPPAPGSVRAAANDGEVTLTWAASAADDVQTYLVFSRSGRSPWAFRGSTETRTFRDRFRDNGRDYRYFVKAVDGSVNVSPPSAETSATPQVGRLRVGVAGNADWAFVVFGTIDSGAGEKGAALVVDNGASSSRRAARETTRTADPAEEHRLTETTRGDEQVRRY